MSTLKKMLINVLILWDFSPYVVNIADVPQILLQYRQNIVTLNQMFYFKSNSLFLVINR